MSFVDEKLIVAVATISFVVLVFKPAKRAILSMIDNKIADIKKNITEAEELKAAAEKLFEQAEAKLAQSEEEAEQILNHANKEAKHIVVSTKEKLGKDVETRKNLALQKIQSFEDNAIRELKGNIAQITVAVASKVIEESDDKEAFENLVVDSLEKVSKTIH